MIISGPFEEMDFSTWLLFKQIILLHGEDRLIEMLEEIKKVGGIKEYKMYGGS